MTTSTSGRQQGLTDDPALTRPGGSEPAIGPRAGRTGLAGLATDRSDAWLRSAAAGLIVLAGAAAAVSFTAQYTMVFAARRLPVIAGLEAAIPDAAALVFASLGIALALQGRRAIRARILNVAAVGTSVFMNTLAAAPGWRSLAIWAMPPVACALASDTLIGVVRALTLERHKSLVAALADEEVTPLAVVGGLVLWLLCLTLASASTLRGLRAWVLQECPVAPGRRVSRPAPAAPVSPARHARAAPALARTARGARPGTKTARFLALAEERGPARRRPAGSWTAATAAAGRTTPGPAPASAGGPAQVLPGHRREPGPRASAGSHTCRHSPRTMRLSSAGESGAVPRWHFPAGTATHKNLTVTLPATRTFVLSSGRSRRWRTPHQ